MKSGYILDLLVPNCYGSALQRGLLVLVTWSMVP